jgi:hypothetical protein
MKKKSKKKSAKYQLMQQPNVKMEKRRDTDRSWAILKMRLESSLIHLSLETTWAEWSVL